MNTRQTLGLIGSLILFVGVFTPIVSIPIVGSMNYFQNGKGDGTIVLGFAVVSVVLVFAKLFKGLWITGLGTIAILAFTFINFQMKIADMKSEMESKLAGNPFRGLADLAIQSVQLQWGWAVLIVGAVLLIASAAAKDESEVAAPFSTSNEQPSNEQPSSADDSATSDAPGIATALTLLRQNNYKIARGAYSGWKLTDPSGEITNIPTDSLLMKFADASSAAPKETRSTSE